jgi:hypothetical protein
MKATLTFNLDDPDDAMNHFRCTQALTLALAIWEIKQELHKDEPNMEFIRDVVDDIDIYKLLQ